MGAETMVVPPEMDEIPRSVCRAWWVAVRLLMNLRFRPFVWTTQWRIPGSNTMVAILLGSDVWVPQRTSKLLALMVGDIV